MHIIFSKEELKWINTSTWGWEIKKGCPDSIRKSIEKKKYYLNNQNTSGKARK